MAEVGRIPVDVDSSYRMSPRTLSSPPALPLPAVDGYVFAIRHLLTADLSSVSLWEIATLTRRCDGCQGFSPLLAPQSPASQAVWCLETEHRRLSAYISLAAGLGREKGEKTRCGSSSDFGRDDRFDSSSPQRLVEDRLKIRRFAVAGRTGRQDYGWMGERGS